MISNIPPKIPPKVNACARCRPSLALGLCQQDMQQDPARPAAPGCIGEHTQAGPRQEQTRQQTAGAEIQGAPGAGCVTSNTHAQTDRDNEDPPPGVEKFWTGPPCPELRGLAGSHEMDTKPSPQETPSPTVKFRRWNVVYRCRVCDHTMSRADIDKATTVLCPSCGVTDITAFECIPFKRPEVTASLYFRCPHCRYLMTPTMHQQANFNNCPRCGQAHLAAFTGVRL